jgi:hypothetical protein
MKMAGICFKSQKGVSGRECLEKIGIKLLSIEREPCGFIGEGAVTQLGGG